MSRVVNAVPDVSIPLLKAIFERRSHVELAIVGKTVILCGQNFLGVAINISFSKTSLAVKSKMHGNNVLLFGIFFYSLALFN